MSGLPPNIPPQLLLQILQAMQAQQGQAPGMGANPAFQQPGAPGGLPGAFGGAMPAGGGAAQVPQNILQGMQSAAAQPMPQQTLDPTSAMQQPGALGTLPGAFGGAMPMGTPGGNQPQMPAPSGARMPNMKKGGMVMKTGPHMLHKGERVIPAPAKSRASTHSASAKKVPAAHASPARGRSTTHTSASRERTSPLLRHPTPRGRKR